MLFCFECDKNVVPSIENGRLKCPICDKTIPVRYRIADGDTIRDVGQQGINDED